MWRGALLERVRGLRAADGETKPKLSLNSMVCALLTLALMNRPWAASRVKSARLA